MTPLYNRIQYYYYPNLFMHYIVVVFVWWPYLTINLSVHYNGGRLPDIILLTHAMVISIGEPV